MTLRATLRDSPLAPFLRPVLDVVRWVQARLHAREMGRFRRYIETVDATVASPLFVHVGANDGVSSDPCVGLLHHSRTWRGLLIEPVPHCFARLAENFPDRTRFTLEQAAIGSPAGTATFYHVDPKAAAHVAGLPHYLDLIGSFDRQHIVRHRDGVLEPYIMATMVRVRLLSDVLRQHGVGVIDLLLVDAEGYDLEVLKTLDFSAYRPRAIFVEHKHLKGRQRELRRLLTDQGYRVRDCGRDYFAVAT